jgi:hypothetical protein
LHFVFVWFTTLESIKSHNFNDVVNICNNYNNITGGAQPSGGDTDLVSSDGTYTVGTAADTSVPEPSSLLLAGTGVLMGLGYFG